MGFTICHSGGDAPPDVRGMAGAAAGEAAEAATDSEKAPAYMAQAVLGFNQQVERICELAVVLLIGALLTAEHVSGDALWFVPLLFLVIRPSAVVLGLAGSHLTRVQRGLICWFGVRGVGSLYYLMYAIQHGVGGQTAQRLTGLALSTIAASVLLHGVSVTPLMNRYEKLSRRRPPSTND